MFAQLLLTGFYTPEHQCFTGGVLQTDWGDSEGGRRRRVVMVVMVVMVAVTAYLWRHLI